MIAPLRTLPVLLAVLATVLSTAACATVVSRPVPAVAQAAPSADPIVEPAVPAAAHGTRNVYLTFYGGPDNDPPGSTDISYPNGRHGSAGGTGSYDDPVTLATDSRELPPGTVVYIPSLKKYFVMEDDCADCITEWGATHRPHLDLWMAATGATLPACEETLTPDGLEPVEINPPAGRPVDLRPLYDPASGRCWSGGS